MKEHNLQLTTPEIAALWTTYIQNSATSCFYKHFLQQLEDAEIKNIMKDALFLQELHNKGIKNILDKEGFPLPDGFSDKDINLSAPPLYTDLFALSFVYRVGQMLVPFYATIITKVARDDVVEFFSDCLSTSTKLYKKSLQLMLYKGIYDRPPKIPYPTEVTYISEHPTIMGSLLGDKSPLNALELGELFYAIERNYIGLVLLIGLIQVTKDKEIKGYLLKGKRLAEKQVETFNKILKKEEHLGNIPVSMEVTNSTDSPFSDRLVMFLITTTSSTGIYLLSYAMSTCFRKDLAGKYALLTSEIAMYGNEGLEIMVKRGWLEQPPQSIDRSKFYK